jgi:transcription elongation factor Elf1
MKKKLSNDIVCPRCGRHISDSSTLYVSTQSNALLGCPHCICEKYRDDYIADLVNDKNKLRSMIAKICKWLIQYKSVTVMQDAIDPLDGKLITDFPYNVIISKQADYKKAILGTSRTIKEMSLCQFFAEMQKQNKWERNEKKEYKEKFKCPICGNAKPKRIFAGMKLANLSDKEIYGCDNCAENIYSHKWAERVATDIIVKEYSEVKE